LPEAVPAGRGLREQCGFRPADRERNPGNFDQGDGLGDVQGDIRADHGRDRGQVVLALQRWDSMSTRPISEAEVDRLVLTVAEAADRLGISSDLAYDLVARGELPSLRLGRRIVIPRIALLEFVESAAGSGQIERGLGAGGR
jgi:excisionase family DNA binding protein